MWSEAGVSGRQSKVTSKQGDKQASKQGDKQASNNGKP
jgi:hypothetical protein